jgi:hypothetical protein
MSPLLGDSPTCVLCFGTVGHDSLETIGHDPSVMHRCSDGVTFRAAMIMCLESSDKETTSPCRRFLVEVRFTLSTQRLLNVSGQIVTNGELKSIPFCHKVLTG